MVFAETISPEWSVGMFGAVPCVVPVYTHDKGGVVPYRLLTFEVNRSILKYVWPEALALLAIVCQYPAYPISRGVPPAALAPDRYRILKAIVESSDQRSQVFGTIERYREAEAS